MNNPRQSLLKILTLPILCCSGLLAGNNSAEASPSKNYQNYLDCWNNYDFITPQNQKHRYCVLNNGIIKQIDSSGKVLTKRIILNQPKKEHLKSKNFREVESSQARKPNYIEHTIEDDELIKYSCKNNKKKPLSSREVQTALRLVLPGELEAPRVQRGTKAQRDLTNHRN